MVPIERGIEGGATNLTPQMYKNKENTISDVITLSTSTGPGVTLRPPLTPFKDIEII